MNESPVYKARVDLDIGIKPTVAPTQYADQPQAAAPVNGGGVIYDRPADVVVSNGNGLNWLHSILLIILICFFSLVLYGQYRSDIARWWYAGSSYTESLKKGDRVATELPNYRTVPNQVVTPQPVAEAPQSDGSNPAKVGWLKACAAKGATVYTAEEWNALHPEANLFHGQLHCNRPRDQLPPQQILLR